MNEPITALYGDEVLVGFSSGLGLSDDAVVLTLAKESQAPVIQRVFMSTAAARELAKALVRAVEES